MNRNPPPMLPGALGGFAAAAMPMAAGPGRGPPARQPNNAVSQAARGRGAGRGAGGGAGRGGGNAAAAAQGNQGGAGRGRGAKPRIRIGPGGQMPFMHHFQGQEQAIADGL